MRLVLHVTREDGSIVSVLAAPGSAPAPSVSALAGSSAVCVAIDPTDHRRVYAGTLDDGLFRSVDGGERWDPVGAGIEQPRVMAVSVSSDGIVYAGTEPSSLYRSADGGDSWEDLARLRELPSAPTWSFPPRPWTHHVRWVAPFAHDDGRLLVGIELGGVMRTLDGGRTWEDRHPDTVIDPHVLAVHQRSSDRTYAVGGDGVAHSHDGGDTWTRHVEGMDRWYTWGLAVDPADPELWYVSAAPGPEQAHGRTGDAGARLYRTRGSGWESLHLGARDLLDTMPYALLAPAPDALIVLLDDGTVHGSDDAGTTWQRIVSGLERPTAMAGVAEI
jgi:photosystem II stability/assembly factor-like uncharacterized protein